MKGFFNSLTPKQQEAALAYEGPENFGFPAPAPASATVPSEEEIARVLATALRQEVIPDTAWAGLVASFRELEAKFPDYAEGYSTSTDAFRQARAVLALFAPILAEKERAERNRDMWKGQCERQAKTLFDLRMQMLADEGQSRE